MRPNLLIRPHGLRVLHLPQGVLEVHLPIQQCEHPLLPNRLHILLEYLCIFGAPILIVHPNQNQILQKADALFRNVVTLVSLFDFHSLFDVLLIPQVPFCVHFPIQIYIVHFYCRCFVHNVQAQIAGLSLTHCNHAIVLPVCVSLFQCHPIARAPSTILEFFLPMIDAMFLFRHHFVAAKLPIRQCVSAKPVPRMFFLEQLPPAQFSFHYNYPRVVEVQLFLLLTAQLLIQQSHVRWLWMLEVLQFQLAMYQFESEVQF